MILDSIVYTECWRGYNVLDVSEFKHYRINHSRLRAEEKKTGVQETLPFFGYGYLTEASLQSGRIGFVQFSLVPAHMNI